MGTENNSEPAFYYWDTCKEEFTAFGPIAHVESIGASVNSRKLVYYPERMNGKIFLTKRLDDCHMSRKRFVKKLMGMGYSRNTANAFALLVQVSDCPYKKAYSLLTTSLHSTILNAAMADLFPCLLF